MTCREVIDYIDRYLDGELTPVERSAFEYHLTLCADCVEYLSNYRQSIALSRAALLPPTEPAGNVPEGLVKAVLEALRKNSQP